MITLNDLIPFPLSTLIVGGHEPERVDDAIAQASEVDRDYDMWVTLIGYMIRIARQETARN